MAARATGTASARRLVVERQGWLGRVSKRAPAAAGRMLVSLVERHQVVGEGISCLPERMGGARTVGRLVAGGAAGALGGVSGGRGSSRSGGWWRRGRRDWRRHGGARPGGGSSSSMKAGGGEAEETGAKAAGATSAIRRLVVGGGRGGWCGYRSGRQQEECL